MQADRALQEAGPALSENWLVAAHILRPQGRRGELLVEPHVSFQLFSAGRRLWLGSSAAAEPAEGDVRLLEQAWQPLGKNAGRVVLKLAQVENISDAEALSGKHLFLRTADLPALEDGTYRVRDLVGCSLFDGPALVGTISDVQFPVAPDGRTRLADAPDLLAVLPATDPPRAIDPEAPDDTETVLVPFVRAWLVNVDLQGKRIEMQLPPGLFGTLDAE